MKKILSLVLALMLMLSLPLAACAEASADDIFTQLPLKTNLVNAVLTEADTSELTFLYENATMEDLYYFLTVSSFFGTYALDITESDILQYFLTTPGTSFNAILLFSEAEGKLFLTSSDTFYTPTDEELSFRLSFLDKELKLPSGKGKNIMPQFNHCVSREPFATTTIGEINSIFNGQLCWTECYNEVTQTMLSSYTIYMTLFGFDVSVNSMMLDENNQVDPIFLHYTNGDAEVIVRYSALDQTAYVFYEPGVSYYLLSASEMQQAVN